MAADIQWLSPSACSTYLQCPLKYKYEKIDKRPQDPSPSLARGNFVHAILEELIALPAEDRTPARAKLIAKDVWAGIGGDNWRLAKDIKALKLSPAAQREFKWESWWCVENYFKVEDPTTVVAEGRERWVKGPVGKGMVRGIVDRFDRTDQGIHVIDYKTGKKPRRPEWADSYIFQLSIYAILLSDELGEKVYEGSLYYLGDGHRADYEMDEGRFESATKTVTAIREGIDERIKNDSFEPQKSKLCDWCSFKPICPAWGGSG